MVELEHVVGADEWRWGGALVWWLNVGLLLVEEARWEVDMAIATVRA